ncbi:MAG: acid shock protein [Clostridia bacterium]|nr:acid shock protein [Clostridia bacterium]
MKKFLALVLALIMTFSVATVAFAAEDTTVAPEEGTTTAPAEGEEEGSVTDELDEMLGDYAWILDLPAESLKPAFKIAKIALKLVKVYFKICSAFGIDPADGIAIILDFVDGLGVGNNDAAEEETTAPEATTAAAAA